MNLSCVECGEGFIFSFRDQTSFQKKGWEEPKRCRDCRNNRKSFTTSMTTIRNKYETKVRLGGSEYTSIDCKDFNAFHNDRNNELKKNFPELHCSFCKNRGHRENTCHLKQSATCPRCRKVGYAVSRGMASGYRNNSSEYACTCWKV